jgi:hypothetical protein
MSDSNDAAMKSVKVPTFNGKKEAFQTWWIRLKEFANANDFLPALSAEAEKNLLTTEDNIAEIDVDQQAAVKRNNMAIYNLTLAFTTDEAMEFYHKGITEEHPRGLAWLIVKALHARFKPQHAISTYEFSKALWSIKWKRRRVRTCYSHASQA